MVIRRHGQRNKQANRSHQIAAPPGGGYSSFDTNLSLGMRAASNNGSIPSKEFFRHQSQLFSCTPGYTNDR